MTDKYLIKIKDNKKLILLTVVFGLFPVVCAAVYSILGGHRISDVYLPASYWNDELIYYKQVEAVVNYGLPQGWFGFQEAHAAKLPFAVWSPVILTPWVIWGKIFGWELVTPIYVNIFINILAMVFFALLVRPNWRQSFFLLLLLAVFKPYSRYMLSGMPEAMYMAMGIVYVALSVSYMREEKKWKLACLFLLCVYMTLGRVYLGLLFLTPAWFALKKKPLAGGAVTVGIIGVTAGISVAINKFCCSPYIFPIIDPKWLKTMLSEGLGAGFSELFTVLWDKIVILFEDYLKRAVKYGLFAGALYAATGLTVCILLAGIVARWRKKKDAGLSICCLLQCLSSIGMVVAIFLLYSMGEGSKHLMIFIVINLLWIAFLHEKYCLMKVAALFMCLFFFGSKAWIPYDWQVPYDDGIMQTEAEELGRQLEENMILTESEDRFDNTVIWLASDMIDGESTTATWGLLYRIPEGFGVNFCTQDYVMTNIDQLQSAYIALLPDGDVEKALLEKDVILVGATEHMKVYKLR